MTEKQIKKLEAEAGLEAHNTLYKDENFALVKEANGYYVRSLTDYDIYIHIQEPKERIFVRAWFTTFFGQDAVGDKIAQKIMAHEFDIVYSHS